jgi:hypothetical protein
MMIFYNSTDRCPVPANIVKGFPGKIRKIKGGAVNASESGKRLG